MYGTTEDIGCSDGDDISYIFVSFRGMRNLSFSDDYVFDPVRSSLQVVTDMVPGFIAGDGTPCKITGNFTDSVTGGFALACCYAYNYF